MNLTLSSIRRTQSEPANPAWRWRSAISLVLFICVSVVMGWAQVRLWDEHSLEPDTATPRQDDVAWKTREAREKALREINEVLDASDRAWNSGDAKTWVSFYSHDAEWTTAAPRSRKTVLRRKELEKQLPRSQFEFHPFTRTRTWITFTAPDRAEVHSVIQFVRGKPVAPFVNGPLIQTLDYQKGSWVIISQYGGAVPYVGRCGVVGGQCCSSWANGGFGPPIHVEICYGNATCSSHGVCVAAPPAPACGTLGNQCCPDPDSADTSYDYCSDPKAVCFPWLGTHGTCEACGASGQAPCPSSGCNSGTVARSGVCVACGGPGQACCSNGCTGGNVCSAANHYTCSACGIEGQAPCAGNVCTGNLHPNFQGGQVVCTAQCGNTQGSPCTQGTEGCDSNGVLTIPQNACVQPLVGSDLSNGGIYYCYGQYPQNSMIDTFGNCTCVPNTLNTCPISTSVPKPPANNPGLCIQGQFTDISGHGCS